jgi:hypothetical protein
MANQNQKSRPIFTAVTNDVNGKIEYLLGNSKTKKKQHKKLTRGKVIANVGNAIVEKGANVVHSVVDKAREFSDNARKTQNVIVGNVSDVNTFIDKTASGVKNYTRNSINNSNIDLTGHRRWTYQVKQGQNLTNNKLPVNADVTLSDKNYITITLSPDSKTDVKNTFERKKYGGTTLRTKRKIKTTSTSERKLNKKTLHLTKSRRRKRV